MNPDHAGQIRDAEELLSGGAQRPGLAKSLYLGHFVPDFIMPFPQLPADQQERLNAVLPALRTFLDTRLDPAAIDRQADIPREVIDGLAHLGLLGMAAPEEFGGQGFSQLAYCQVMEEVGGRCASTSIFINAHHSIGLRALVLFGTPEQKRRWLAPLARGEKLAAFALTEPEAGSDAGNVQTRASLSEDGTHYVLNGEKRYITNAALADVLTVMARTPDNKITAFLVTPDMPGFVITEPRMSKLGIRGTATARLAFHDMPVPKENVLGEPGRGLKVALTVLDYGRATFGACCTGAAKTCLQLAVNHANTRRQFGRTLGEFELIKKKLARMAADIYAMESMTTVTASLIDSGIEDCMIETAMLKVMTSEALWRIVNDTFQIFGGAAYFTDRPLERMLRDARINQIGEGANEVLASFIALAGLRGPGLQFQEMWDALHHPWKDLGKAWRIGLERIGAAVHAPNIPVRSNLLQSRADHLSGLIRHFSTEVDRVLIQFREEILDRQYVQQRIAGAAVGLYSALCVLSRWDAELLDRPAAGGKGPAAADLYLHRSFRRIRRWLSELHENEDELVTSAANEALRG